MTSRAITSREVVFLVADEEDPDTTVEINKLQGDAPSERMVVSLDDLEQLSWEVWRGRLLQIIEDMDLTTGANRATLAALIQAAKERWIYGGTFSD